MLLACAALLRYAGPAYADMPVASPYGADRFCILSPSFCDERTTVSAPLSDMSILERINATVNVSIVPEALDTPRERRIETRDWRVVMPDMLGACVEYATTKEWLLAWGGRAGRGDAPGASPQSARFRPVHDAHGLAGAH